MTYGSPYSGTNDLSLWKLALLVYLSNRIHCTIGNRLGKGCLLIDGKDPPVHLCVYHQWTWINIFDVDIFTYLLALDGSKMHMHKFVVIRTLYYGQSWVRMSIMRPCESDVNHLSLLVRTCTPRHNIPSMLPSLSDISDSLLDIWSLWGIVAIMWIT